MDRWDLERLRKSAAPAPAPDAPGAQLGRYILIRTIAAGAMGVVHEAEDTQLKRRVAVKVLHGVHDASGVVRQRFQREAIAAASLSHPNVLQIYDAGEVDGRMFLAMELVTGEGLHEILARKPLDPRKVLPLLVKSARGIAAAHDRGIIHRDVKPANILVTPEGEPKVADFGLAHLIDSNTQLTRSGFPLGTPVYMAPEQVRGDPDSIRPAIDIYALGVILYEILAGRLPHTGQTPVEIYGRIISQDPIPPRRINPKIDVDLETICLKALAYDPGHRYATALLFADDLQRFLDGEPIHATPPSVGARARRWVGRHRAMATGAALTLVFAALSAFWILRTREADRIRDEQRLALDEASKQLGIARTMLDRAAKSFYRRDADLPETLRSIDDARKKIEAVVAKSPGLVEAHFVLGCAWDLVGRGTRAESSWRKALELDSKFGPAHFKLGRLLLARAFIRAIGGSGPLGGDLTQKAISHLDRARREGSGFDDALQREMAEAMSAYVRNDHPRVDQICSNGARQFKGSDGVEEFLWLGSCVKPEADRRALLDQAIAIRPWYPVALLCRANLLSSQGNPDGAIADYSMAIQADPLFSMAYVQRSLEHLRRGRIDESLDDATAALRLDPEDIDGYLARGQALTKLGKRVEAAADFERALEIEPGNGRAMSGRGLLKLRSGDVEGAIVDFTEAIRRDPAVTASWQGRASASMRQGRYDAAIEDYTKAIDLSPRSAGLLSDRGRAWFLKGDLDRAVADADRALVLDPKYVPGLLGRAQIHRKAMRLDAAIADVTEAIRLEPGHAMAFVDRSQLRILQGDWKAALEDTNEAARRDPSLPEALFARATIKERLGDIAGAVADLERCVDGTPGGSPIKTSAETKLSQLRK